MNDMFAALLLIDHFSGRKRPECRDRPEPVREEESRWARILSWHRRK